MVYASDAISDDILGQAEIDISRQPRCVTIEALRTVDDGIPFKMVDTKTGREQGILYLAFALSCSPDVDSTHAQARHDSTIVNLSGQIRSSEKLDCKHEVTNSRKTVLGPESGKQLQDRIIRLPFDRRQTHQTEVSASTIHCTSSPDAHECALAPGVQFDASLGLRFRVHELEKRIKYGQKNLQTLFPC